MKQEQGRRLKKRLFPVLCIVIFAVGLALLLYPYIADKWNTWRQSKLITNYSDSVSRMSSADLEDEWERARAYNEALLPSVLPDSFAIAEAKGESDPEYMACLNVNGDGIMGYVSIPKIDVNLPIFHTTSEDVLQQGAGHLEGSSLPVGGENTHAVIAAHRGLASAKMFTDLDQLEAGDHFLLTILDDTLCYEVDQILVVEPTDTDALQVETGEDLVTLLTCTPYGVNTQRLLVRGHRVPYDPDVEDEAGTASPVTHASIGMFTACGLVAAGVIILIIYLVQKRRGGFVKRKHR